MVAEARLNQARSDLRLRLQSPGMGQEPAAALSAALEAFQAKWLGSKGVVCFWGTQL